MHPAKQDLRCPGCKKLFDRLGGLIGHIELEQCSALLAKNMEAARKDKEMSNAAVKSAHEFQDFSRMGALGANGPHPLAMQQSRILQAQQAQQAQQAPQAQQAQQVQQMAVPPPTKAFFNDDDLLGVNVLDLPWGPESEVMHKAPMPSQFPVLGSRPPPIMASQVVNSPAPGKKPAPVYNPLEDDSFPPPILAKLVPDAPVPVRNSKENQFPALSLSKPAAPTPVRGAIATTLQTQFNPPPSASKPDATPNPHDPNSPGFKAEHYYIPVLGKFKCPHLGCG